MTNPSEFLFTSESVTEGHPDKVADQISDGVLDAVLSEDPLGRVACETLVNTGLVVVSGEITTETYVDFQGVARETSRKIGYTDADLPVSAHSANGMVVVETDAPTQALHRLTDWAIRHGRELNGLTVERPSLEEVYLELTRAGAPRAPERIMR